MLNSSVSYLFSYKRALIIADQKKYIDSLYHYSGKILLGIGQIVIIILTKNFILYLVLKFIEIIVENILISRKIDKMYPLLNWNSDEKIEQSDMQLITKNVKALFFHRIGGVVVTGTDNLLIARFISLSAVGIYSNYNLIITSLDTMINIVFQSVTASVGNLGAIKEYTKTRANFEWIDFMGFWVISFSTVALLNLLNPSILIWLCLTTITISNLVSNKSYLGFAYKMLITLIVPNVIILILFKEKSEFKQTINLFKTFLIEKVS